MAVSVFPDEFSLSDETLLSRCRLCPRQCGADRLHGETGFCGCGPRIRAARAALHFWEEPCISGTAGSGTVFFSGCTLRCRYCQNYKISAEGFGKELSSRALADVFLRLQDEGAHNISLVTATQFLPPIVQALDLIRGRLHIPVVCNSGGYERVETVRALRDYVDIWLPDLKYYSAELSGSFSQAPDYFSAASRAIMQMVQQTGAPVIENGIMKRGVIIRHLVLPGHRDDSLSLLHWLADELPRGRFLISLMSQYTPYRKDADYPELNRRVTTYEYEKVIDAAWNLGLTAGYMQKKSSAREEYTPPFTLKGLF